MTRWLVLSLALVAAAAAFYVLAAGGPAPGDEPLDHIDAASRAKLERVLREAEAGESKD